MANNSSPAPCIFPNCFPSLLWMLYKCCDCAYSMCKMSVTHGGVFAALQSSRHTHISLSFSLVSISLPRWPSVAPGWGVGSVEQKREQQPPLHSLVWSCFMQKSVAALFSIQGTRTELVTQARGGSGLIKVLIIWGGGGEIVLDWSEQIYNLPRGLRSPNVPEGRDLLFGLVVRSVQSGQHLLRDPSRLERLFLQESLDHPAVKKPRHVSVLY